MSLRKQIEDLALDLDLAGWLDSTVSRAWARAQCVPVGGRDLRQRDLCKRAPASLADGPPGFADPVRGQRAAGNEQTDLHSCTGNMNNIVARKIADARLQLESVLRLYCIGHKFRE